MSKFSSKPTDTQKELGNRLMVYRVEVNDSQIFEVTIESNADDQTIPASLFTAFPNLVRLFADRQNIRVIKPKTFENAKLEYLGIDYHRIQKLEANTFEGLKNLRTLLMKGGSLVEIDVAAFNGLDSLQTLNLAENRIKVIFWIVQLGEN
jgi:Leucine-rich repeat (LRR) protein